MKKKPEIIAANYCIGFVDLLGQRDEYKGEGLLPKFNSVEERDLFNQKIRKTIRPIFKLQEDAEKFISSALKGKNSLRNEIPLPLQDAFDQLRKVKLKQQRWSDGLVYFVSLIHGNVKCPISGIFHLLGTLGNLCFLGLCKKSPLRGSVDISWAVELHPGEIYGAAVANAYELESKIAQYPRIVVSERLIEYLHVNTLNDSEDIFSQFNRKLAEICLKMIAIDFDGIYFLNYLGITFKESITKGLHEELYDLAFEFIEEQLELWHKNKNTKLSMRYNCLYSYFLTHKEEIKQRNAQPENSADPKGRAAD